MTKRVAILLFTLLSVESASSAPKTPVDEFISDSEFCAYMASPPENNAKEFLSRYQAAMQDATSFLRQQNKNMTETQAIFSIKAKCDEALTSLLHYK